eukprot:CAMPEP_0119177976 /NCGR_PEP_ID=MMETSP1315-20130426/50316_1 /TAXON_ID=676789 /ORGANISM="Prasinoderma singularis, Strain RCC927" /LENGTH=107 /DNA_ID=CAMNT_0007172153 /DNA_START=5 /DNA_END=325 /DNA_ORIENTATION=-
MSASLGSASSPSPPKLASGTCSRMGVVPGVPRGAHGVPPPPSSAEPSVDLRGAATGLRGGECVARPLPLADAPAVLDAPADADASPLLPCRNLLMRSEGTTPCLRRS